MQINTPHKFTQSILFRMLVILSTFVLMPALWGVLTDGTWETLAPRRMLDSWVWVIKNMFGLSAWAATLFVAFGVVSIMRWWRKPSVGTALLLYFAVPVVCGIPGIGLLSFLSYAR